MISKEHLFKYWGIVYHEETGDLVKGVALLRYEIRGCYRLIVRVGGVYRERSAPTTIILSRS